MIELIISKHIDITVHKSLIIIIQISRIDMKCFSFSHISLQEFKYLNGKYWYMILFSLFYIEFKYIQI